MRPARSYDPIRCQEPQWPRRPLAIGRRGLPLTRPGPPRHVIDAFGSVSYPRIPFCRPALHSFGGVPQVCRGACGGLRAHSEIGGIPEGRPARRDGAVSIPRPPGTSCRGPRATSRARPRWPRWPSPRACRGRASPRAAAGAADGGRPQVDVHPERGRILWHGSLPTSLRRGCAYGTSTSLSQPRPAVTSGGSYLFSALGLGHSVCRCQNIGVAVVVAVVIG